MRVKFEQIKPALALFIITLFAAAVLGFVRDATSESIAAQKLSKETEVVSRLINGTDETYSSDVEPTDSSVKRVIYCAGNKKILGFAIVSEPSGYGGRIEMITAVTTEGTIAGVEILSHSETPGLGANAALPGYTVQYIGKTGRLYVTTSKGSGGLDEIEAVTGATISSNAVTSGVNDSFDYYQICLSSTDTRDYNKIFPAD